MRVNYTIIISSGNKEEKREGFALKSDAIALAKEYRKCVWYDDATIYIRSERHGKRTYMLPRHRCACVLCGEQLNGKNHCPLCNANHYYC